MTCSLVRSLLDDLVDREIPAGTETALKDHLKACAACRTEYEELVRLKETLSQAECPEPSSEYWGEVRDLILARTVDADAAVDIGPGSEVRARERSSFYRSILAVAASLAVFVTSLWLGSTGPAGMPARTFETGLDGAGYLTSAATTTDALSADEQDLIAGSMLLVGAPGMFASPTEMSAMLGLDRSR